jgi:hypothetical protein
LVGLVGLVGLVVAQARLGATACDAGTGREDHVLDARFAVVEQEGRGRQRDSTRFQWHTVGDRAIADGWHRDDDGDAIGGTGRRCRMLSALCGLFCAVRCGAVLRLSPCAGGCKETTCRVSSSASVSSGCSRGGGEKRGRQGTWLAAGQQAAGSRQRRQVGQQRAAWKEHPVHVPRRPLLPCVAKHRTGCSRSRSLFGRRRWMAKTMVVVRVMVMATYGARCNL